MSLFDLVLLVIIGGFALFGLWFGLVHTLGSMVGTVLGVFLATRYYAPFADWLVNTIGLGANFSKVLVFVIAFLIINRLVGLAFYFVDRILSIFTRLPFIRGLDRILGLVFGLLEGALVIGIIFYFIVRFPIGANFMAALSASLIAPYTIKLASVLLPFVPDAIKMLRSTIEGVM